MKKKQHLKPLKTPVYRDSGFRLDDATVTASAFRDEQEQERKPGYYIYSRYRNPTVVAVEEQLMNIEQSEWALLMQSGMSAIDTALSIFQEAGSDKPWLFFSEIYGGTNTFIDEVLIKRRGIRAERLFPENNRYDPSYFRRRMEETQASLVFLEVVTNPMLMVTDAPAIIDIAHEMGARVVVDNTFATPYLFKPLQAGADLVIHSATKYLSGHGDVTAGVICGNLENLLKKAVEYRKYVGHMISPDDAYRLGTQLRTFPLRMQKHVENAERLAHFLDDHPAVEATIYPGLEHHPDHFLADRLFGGRGYGGMITFDLAGKNAGEKKNRRDRFIRALQNTVPLIPSLGDADSTLLPVEPVWGDKYPGTGLIRLSVGIEPCEELEKNIGRALNDL
ncbi:MAG: trans-sulfuration enzyme family protein [Bacteroidales bacterium]